MDVAELVGSAVLDQPQPTRPFVAPRSAIEREIAAAWMGTVNAERVSVHDGFFDIGGNSLLAVRLIRDINRRLGSHLGLQVIFEEQTIEGLARRVQADPNRTLPRLVSLQADGSGPPVYCWPGLGGYPMNLRDLAAHVPANPFYGVQAEGINPGETPHSTIEEMARHDVALLRELQPDGPYTLWGYSFGARVAFEAAHQLESAGERVEQLVLIAPGSPLLRPRPHLRPEAGGGEFGDSAFVTILYSVFTGSTSGTDLEFVLDRSRDQDSFVQALVQSRPELDAETVQRITQIVRMTYSFRYTFDELLDKRVTAPMIILKARGDDYSFVEEALGALETQPEVVQLELGHYQVLNPAGAASVTAAVKARRRGLQQTL